MNDAALARLRALAGIDAPGVWVVGGAVRDVLLGREPHEADLVLEGDAVELARTLGHVAAVHERFGTATVLVDGRSVDLASARLESYARPGALPDVEPAATIEEDLLRRDFTVNAIAVRLADGEERAVEHAHEDLRARVLRVLHEASFRDDPTRLLRLARYTARLGFEPEAHTAELARAAVGEGALDTVTGPRLGTELRLLAGEPQPAGLRALGALGLGEALFGAGFDPDPQLIERALELTPADLDRDLIAFHAAVIGVPDLDARQERLGWALRDRVDVTRVAALASALRTAGEDPVALHRAAARATPEQVVLAGALGAPAGARAWLEGVRHARTAISGEDLLAAGLAGPAIGQALERALETALGGGDRDAQLRAALGTSPNT